MFIIILLSEMKAVFFIMLKKLFLFRKEGDNFDERVSKINAR